MTVDAELTVTTQVRADPVQPPDQPAKFEPLFARAVSVTRLPLTQLAEQLKPQKILLSPELTIPDP